MNTSEPLFWMMVSLIVIAVAFVVMAITLIVIAYLIRKTAFDIEQRISPVFDKLNSIGEQVNLISHQFNEVSKNLNTATQYFADSAGLIKEEVRELKQLVGVTAIEAKEKVDLVNKTIEQTQVQVVDTTQFIQAKVVKPAAEFAAIMAGVRKGLEVLFAPSPKQIDRVYQEDEMFIG